MENPRNPRGPGQDGNGGEDYGGYQGGGGDGGDTGNTGLNVYGCTGDQVKINIDGNGRPGAEECVDQAEASRRNRLWIGANPGTPAEGGGGGEGAGAPSGPAPAGRPDYGKAPQFTAPQFAWGEQWQAPTLEQARNEPGYQFAADEGTRALQQSAAARGVLGSGGTLKDISSWANRFAEQNYGNVFDRSLQGYNTRFGTAKDIFDRFYTGKKDEYTPKLLEWQTNAHGADLGFANAWAQWNRDNLSAQDLWNGQG